MRIVDWRLFNWCVDGNRAVCASAQLVRLRRTSLAQQAAAAARPGTRSLPGHADLAHCSIPNVNVNRANKQSSCWRFNFSAIYDRVSVIFKSSVFTQFLSENVRSPKYSLADATLASFINLESACPCKLWFP